MALIGEFILKTDGRARTHNFILIHKNKSACFKQKVLLHLVTFITRLCINFHFSSL